MSDTKMIGARVSSQTYSLLLDLALIAGSRSDAIVDAIHVAHASVEPERFEQARKLNAAQKALRKEALGTQ